MSSPAQGDEPLADQLRTLLAAVEATGRAVLPASSDELLETIVEAAARIFGAAAASIALLEEDGRALVFRVAYGVGRDEVVGLRIGSDQGIAGYVASTGQPLAISNVQQDPRFARQTAEQTGYVPRSILAMPLLLGERVIGVMEVLDKLNAPSFGLHDMELLGLFARQAALAIHHAQQTEHLNQALLRGLQDLVTPEAAPQLLEAIQSAPDAAAHDLAAIAARLNAIAALGDAERRTCLQILDAFADYARARTIRA